jgi:restriction endonuclease Mrr
MPTQREFLYPIVEVLRSAGGPLRTRDLNHQLEDRFALSAGARTLMRPSGGCTAFYQRLTFALSQLKRLALVEQPSRGQWQATRTGRGISESELHRKMAELRLHY